MTDQRGGGIAWTDQTWNPVRGCSRVSEGCRNCYAERVAARFSGPGQAYEGLATLRRERLTGRVVAGNEAERRVDVGARWTGKVVLVPEHLADPLRWKRPRRVFVNSMSDLFHEGLSNEQIAEVFAVMACAPRHTFQVLTKRAHRMFEWFRWAEAHPYRDGSPGGGPLAALAEALCCSAAPLPGDEEGEGLLRKLVEAMWPLSNVWLGVSVEDQKTADERIPLLLEAPAAVRWVSYEPALGPVDFRRYLTRCWLCPKCGWAGELGEAAWKGIGNAASEALCAECGSALDADLGPSLDWIVVGGESGPGAREFKAAWARATVAQCKDASVPCFVKQLGSRSVFDEETEHADWLTASITGKGGDPDEWPDDLRVREFPGARPLA